MSQVSSAYQIQVFQPCRSDDEMAQLYGCFAGFPCGGWLAWFLGLVDGLTNGGYQNISED